jgi:hypothetical protein
MGSKSNGWGLLLIGVLGGGLCACELDVHVVIVVWKYVCWAKECMFAVLLEFGGGSNVFACGSSFSLNWGLRRTRCRKEQDAGGMSFDGSVATTNHSLLTTTNIPAVMEKSNEVV